MSIFPGTTDTTWTDLRPAPPTITAPLPCGPVAVGLPAALRLLGDPGGLRVVQFGADSGRTAEVLLARGATEVTVFEATATGRAEARRRLRRHLGAGLARIDALSADEGVGGALGRVSGEVDVVLHLGDHPLEGPGVGLYRDFGPVLTAERGMLILGIAADGAIWPTPLEVAMHELFAAGFVVDGIVHTHPGDGEGPVTLRARRRG